MELYESEKTLDLKALRTDCSLKQKNGLHFILASVFIWSVIFVVQLLDFPPMTKNLLTFCCTAPLMPLAFFISKLIKVDFQNKENPLTNLGIIFSLNQLLYLLIAMWIYNVLPGKMVMVLAMIFGAHLLPFSWLYQSKSYLIFSVLIPFTALITGLKFSSVFVALLMIIVEISFSIALWLEVKRYTVHQKSI